MSCYVQQLVCYPSILSGLLVSELKLIGWRPAEGLLREQHFECTSACMSACIFVRLHLCLSSSLVCLDAVGSVCLSHVGVSEFVCLSFCPPVYLLRTTIHTQQGSELSSKPGIIEQIKIQTCVSYSATLSAGLSYSVFPGPFETDLHSSDNDLPGHSVCVCWFGMWVCWFGMCVCAVRTLSLSACRVLFQNKTEVWEEIEAKMDAENDTPVLKTSNKVCNSKLCVSKYVYLVDVCVSG